MTPLGPCMLVRSDDIYTKSLVFRVAGGGGGGGWEFLLIWRANHLASLE